MGSRSGIWRPTSGGAGCERLCGRHEVKVPLNPGGPRAATTSAIGAADILRGVARALGAGDQAVLTEMPLANGRRADLMALDRAGLITLVEIKSSRADFLADRKWRGYLDFCRPVLFRGRRRLPARAPAGGRGADPWPTASPARSCARRARAASAPPGAGRSCCGSPGSRPCRLQGVLIRRCDRRPGPRPGRLSPPAPRPATPRSGSGRCCRGWAAGPAGARDRSAPRA